MKNKRIDGKLCFWNEKKKKYIPFTQEELSIAYTSMCTAYDGKCEEIKRLKQDIVYRLNTIIGDYESD